jgi:RimJ/RimL family protein N-acetyltransferase
MRAVAGRVTLRPVKRVDFAQIEAWYADASAAVRGGEIDTSDTIERRSEEAKDRLLTIAADDREPIGLIEYRVHEPAEGWLSTTFIALKGGRRGFGYGSEAVRVLEAWAEKSHQVTSFLAEINPRNGLALYFWLRVGYRPAHEGEVFWRAPNEGGIIATIRTQ